MKLLVCYDIEDDKIRNKLSSFLEKIGLRLQKSVFLLDIKRYKYGWLLREIKKIVKEDNNIIVFDLCKGCLQKAVILKDDSFDFNNFIF